MIRVVAVVAAVALATPAVAQTQAQMNAAADGAFHRADTAMAAQWKTTRARMKARDAEDRSRGGGFGYAAALLESQRAWLKFRSTECALEGGQFAGGSMQGMITTRCETGLTNDRTKQLHELEWRERRR